MSQQVGGTSPFSAVFLLHIALEAPIAIQGLWSAMALPFLELNNTTLVVVKLYAALSLGSCLAALLVYPLPEFLPGKRALAISLVVYHTFASTILYQTPRFIPMSFGAFCESYKFTPEIMWGTAHGVLGLALLFWWQATVGQAAAVRKMQ